MIKLLRPTSFTQCPCSLTPVTRRCFLLCSAPRPAHHVSLSPACSLNACYRSSFRLYIITVSTSDLHTVAAFLSRSSPPVTATRITHERYYAVHGNHQVHPSRIPLSLPPEIRNMIYHYIFTPVRDGTCLVVYTDWDMICLQGIRRKCFLCKSAQVHTTCRPEYAHTEDIFHAFELSGNSARSSILRTCNAVLKEASPISLACMHISISYTSRSIKRRSRALQVLLAYMHQPKGAYSSAFTCTYHDSPGGGDDMKRFSQMVNGLGIRLGHLVLCAVTSSHCPGIGQYFVSTLDSLIHKPAKVEWALLSGTGTTSYRFNSQRTEFNEAAEKWLAKLPKVKAFDSTAHLPLLRDPLPHFFEESAG
jgi:hypothetical protein